MRVDERDRTYSAFSAHDSHLGILLERGLLQPTHLSAGPCRHCAPSIFPWTFVFLCKGNIFETVRIDSQTSICGWQPMKSYPVLRITSRMLFLFATYSHCGSRFRAPVESNYLLLFASACLRPQWSTDHPRFSTNYTSDHGGNESLQYRQCHRRRLQFTDAPRFGKR
jgi:hypothetical protein